MAGLLRKGFVPRRGLCKSVSHFTENGTAVLNKTNTNLGASGTITLTLPALSTAAGKKIDFEVKAGQALRVDPDGSEKIFINGAEQAAGKYVECSAVGGRLRLYKRSATVWATRFIRGTWTVEA